MTEQGGDHFSWVCLSCGRRVPTRFEECRCGFKKDDLPPAVVTEMPAAAPAFAPARSGPAASLLVILGAAIGLGIAVYIVQSNKSQQPAPQQQTENVAPQTSSPTEQDAPVDGFVAPFTGTITLRPPTEPATNAVVAPTPTGSIEDIVSKAL